MLDAEALRRAGEGVEIAYLVAAPDVPERVRISLPVRDARRW